MRTMRCFCCNGDASKRGSKELSEVFRYLFAIRVCGVPSHNTDFRLAHCRPLYSHSPLKSGLRHSARHGKGGKVFSRLYEVLMGKPSRGAFDPEVFLTKRGKGKTILELRKNQTLFVQGDVADRIFYIQQGKVKLSILSEEGKEAVMAILTAGHFVGEGCLNGHRAYVATTTALEDCLITSVTKPAMLSFLHEEPRFSDFFMTYLLTRNSRIEEDLIDQLFNSSERRLARTLLLLANFGK